MKLTDWFPARKKPTIEGVYQRRESMFDVEYYYSRFSGGLWYALCFTADEANKTKTISDWQSLEWRGLAEEPK